MLAVVAISERVLAFVEGLLDLLALLELTEVFILEALRKQLSA